MKNNEIKLIFRGLKKNKIVLSINILGLAIGFAFVILAGRYVYTEMTFDHFHENHKTLYRVEWTTSDKFTSSTPNIMHSWLTSKIPEVKHVTRIINDAGGLMKRNIMYNNTKYNVNNPLIVDYDFFGMFSFKVLLGEIKSFENDKYSAALTRPFATKVFGADNPVGKTISYKGELFIVRAVLDEPPANSSVKFEMLLPIANIPSYATMDWQNNTLETFIQSHAGISPLALQQKIHDGIISEFNLLGYTEQAATRHFRLNPLDKIYYSDILYDNVCIHGNSRNTLMLLSLAILVLIIAMFNYTNAVLANATENMKGIGIRSVVGASRLRNIGYMICQSVLPCIIAMALAVFFTLSIENVTGQVLSIPLVKMRILHFMTIIGSTLLFGILVGIWPAVKLTSGKITDLLNERTKSGENTTGIGNVFSVAQFAASIVLIISVFSMYKQIDFVLKQSGKNMDEEFVVYMPLANRTEQKGGNIATIQEALKLLPEVKGVSTGLSLPGDEFYSNLRGLPLKYDEEERTVDVNHDMVDAGYPEVMGYKIKKGKSFDASLKLDYKSYLVNEAFIKKYGIHDISVAQLNGSPIIGVMQDFHYNSLHKEIEPLAIRYENSYQSRIVVKLAPPANGSFSEIIKKINKVVDSVDNTAVTDILFLDQHIAALYDKEIKMSKILFVLAFFSILISCMGLFSMSLFITEKRTKEIGIRKVNGAKISEVLVMLNKDFVKWVAIAFVIACPIAWYIMNKWLENFAYKTELSWWIFALTGLLALGIALLTVSWQSWKAATRNPVEVLRNE